MTINTIFSAYPIKTPYPMMIIINYPPLSSTSISASRRYPPSLSLQLSLNILKYAGPLFDNALSGVEAGEPGEGAAGIEFTADIVLARSIPDNTIVTNNLR